MMKSTKLISTIAFAFMVLFAFNAEAQDFKPLDKSPMDRAYYPAQAPVRAFAKTDEEMKIRQLINKKRIFVRKSTFLLLIHLLQQ